MHLALNAKCVLVEAYSRAWLEITHSGMNELCATGIDLMMPHDTHI
jgi:hypothetical protein